MKIVNVKITSKLPKGWFSVYVSMHFDGGSQFMFMSIQQGFDFPPGLL